ncbi:hypothetical protein L2E82_14690 [Cichorium intybus]|uniref:Uncharacterized protein n=1 Tax=Cichorium intybus TaxID=13427 RepID=A0ACB9F053_CICIN|nr:hypothetical protein L2E82_14690 [Cichorium intybus]
MKMVFDSWEIVANNKYKMVEKACINLHNCDFEGLKEWFFGKAMKQRCYYMQRLFRPSSIERASVMGLRVTKSVKDYPHGTPVFISMDVTGKKRNLKLDGIIRTVITLGCNRCCGSAS